MKKIISVLLVSLVLLCACGKSEENKENDFYLNYNNYNLELNKEFSINDYGQYTNSFENESCAFGDRDITYFYKDVEIETYEDKNGKLIVYSIRIVGEEEKTNEGIGLYDMIDDVIKVYGDNYLKNDNKYTYNRNNTSLIFITQNGIVQSIEYRITNIE